MVQKQSLLSKPDVKSGLPTCGGSSMLKRTQVCLSGVSGSTGETITAAQEASAFVSLWNGNNKLSNLCNDSVTDLRVLKVWSGDQPQLRGTKWKMKSMYGVKSVLLIKHFLACLRYFQNKATFLEQNEESRIKARLVQLLKEEISQLTLLLFYLCHCYSVF